MEMAACSLFLLLAAMDGKDGSHRSDIILVGLLMGRRFTIFRALVDFSIYGETILVHPRANLSDNRSNFLA